MAPDGTNPHRGRDEPSEMGGQEMQEKVVDEILERLCPLPTDNQSLGKSQVLRTPDSHIQEQALSRRQHPHLSGGCV